jgi:AcrR family transcriptional regulator
MTAERAPGPNRTAGAPREGTDHPRDEQPSGVVGAGELGPEPPARSGPGTYDRQKSPEERRDEQRRRLILAAARVFSRDGFAGASVASILEVSGLSRGTFYRHFEDLPDVFLAVRRSAAELAYEVVSRSVRCETEPVARLRAGILSFLELIAQHGDLARVLLRDPQARGDEQELFANPLASYVALMREGLEEAMARNLIKRVPNEITIHALVCAIQGVGIRYLERHEEAKATEAAPALFNFCVRAFS